VALNIGLVAVLTALIAMPHGGTSGLTVGFGLFAVLSIVRLRSEASSLTEVAYFFTALALGVVNGVGLQALGLMIVLDVVLVGSMALLELTRRPDEGERQVLVADEVFDSRALLVEHLSRRLGAHVSDVQVVEVDLVRETTRVEALVTEARARGLPTAPERNVVPWQLGRRRPRGATRWRHRSACRGTAPGSDRDRRSHRPRCRASRSASSSVAPRSRSAWTASTSSATTSSPISSGRWTAHTGSWTSRATGSSPTTRRTSTRPRCLCYRAHVQGRRRRFKARSRLYVESSHCVFEVKLRGRCGETVKHALAQAPGQHGVLTPEARAFVGGHVQSFAADAVGFLEPCLATRYRRITLVSLERPERLTCDLDLRFSTAGGEHGRLAEDYVLIETKSGDGRSAADITLSRLGARPLESVSKYCIGIALSGQDLPTNPFRRLLRRHFEDAPPAPARPRRR
jgi:hypothetical protein